MNHAENTKSEERLRLDVDAVLKSKLGKKSRFVPRFVVKWLKKTICQDKLNTLLNNNAEYRDAEFCKGVLKDLNITYNIVGTENIDTSNRRVVIASNHPLGGLDGMVLIDYFSTLFGGKISFLVNDILMAIKPLDGVFLPINKHGAQSREAFKEIDAAFAGDDPILIFPAGLCSRRGKDGRIADLEWHKMFVAKSIEYSRDIIPIHFAGHNSDFFYKLANRRKRLGIKQNIEMIYLPGEIFKNEGANFTITIGDTISHQSLPPRKVATATARQIYNNVYSLTEKFNTAHESNDNRSN